MPEPSADVCQLNPEVADGESQRGRHDAAAIVDVHALLEGFDHPLQALGAEGEAAVLGRAPEHALVRRCWSGHPPKFSQPASIGATVRRRSTAGVNY